MTEPSRSSRRDFLTAAPVRSSVELPEASALPESGSPSAPAYLLQISRRAMACDFIVHLNAGQYRQAAELALDALDLLEPLEQQMSVYRPDSDICRVNQQAVHRPVPVESGLLSLLQQAMQLYHQTGGALDITAGPLVKQWGFFRRQGRMPTEQQIQEAIEWVGSHHIQIDGSTQTIRFLRPGVEINLGAIGKGYALDRCSDRLLESGVHDFLIHGGFSSLIARGQRHNRNEGPGWLVALRHPLRPRQAIAEIWLRNQALATSGSGTQSFHYQGKRYGHILDPRSGMPAKGVLSATAITPDATRADALSTAFYVMGLEATREYCEAHSDAAALMITPGERAGTVALDAIGLADDQWRACDSA